VESALESWTSDDAPTLLLKRRYFTPALPLAAVVTAEALLAVPVRLAVTVVHANVPPVFVNANVFVLYVKAVACVLREDAAVPLATFVNRRRYATALVVLLMVIVEPDPTGPLTSPTSKIAAEDVPTFTKVGVEPAGNALTVPTVIVGLVPGGPSGPGTPAAWITRMICILFVSVPALES
jgi:hypothetical protein